MQDVGWLILEVNACWYIIRIIIVGKFRGYCKRVIVVGTFDGGYIWMKIMVVNIWNNECGHILG
jgi:hypothetical protein